VAENTSYLIPSDRFRPIVKNWINQHRAGSLAPPELPPPSAANPELSYTAELQECTVNGENAIKWGDCLMGSETSYYRWNNFEIRAIVERPRDTIVHLIYDYGGSQIYDTVALGEGFSPSYRPLRSMTLSGWKSVGLANTGLIPNYNTRFGFRLIFENSTLIVLIDGNVSVNVDGLDPNVSLVAVSCQNFDNSTDGYVRFHDLQLWGWN